MAAASDSADEEMSCLEDGFVFRCLMYQHRSNDGVLSPILSLEASAYLQAI